MAISIEDIDDDLRERLERLRQERGVSFEEVVNDVIQHGLDAAEAKRTPFRTRVVKGAEPLFNSPEELKELVAQLDEEEARRKLGLK